MAERGGVKVTSVTRRTVTVEITRKMLEEFLLKEFNEAVPPGASWSFWDSDRNGPAKEHDPVVGVFYTQES